MISTVTTFKTSMSMLLLQKAIENKMNIIFVTPELERNFDKKYFEQIAK